MKKHKETVCPGCSRHCPLSHVHCKYGQKYIQKRRSAPDDQKKEDKTAHRRKWEKHVSKGSAAWRLLDTGRRLKRALRKESVTERQIHLALSDEEQAQLRTLLMKISEILE